MLDHARAHFEHDRKTYFLDAQLSKVPVAAAVPDADLPDLLNQFDARQVLHVAFGSILDAYRDPLRALIAAHEDAFVPAWRQHLCGTYVRLSRPGRDRHLPSTIDAL
jgi:hypothetical protein